jgi:hypothetical protein
MKNGFLFYIHGMFRLAVFLFTAGTIASAADSNRSTLRLEDILWREVHNRDGTLLGATSDVLIQMPSGQIVFILVKPTELYSEPKAIPPSALALPEDSKAPIKLDVTMDEWINSPRLDWDPKLIVKFASEGEQIYGYYHQEWLLTATDAAPSPTQGVEVVAPRGGATEATRFVSLSNLLLHRVATEAWDQEGFIRGFLLDWRNKRATHAIASHTFTTVPAPNEQWFAIPVGLLNPPAEQESITVRAEPKAFVEAQPLSSDQEAASRSTSQISLFPAGVVVGVTAPPTTPTAAE